MSRDVDVIETHLPRRLCAFDRAGSACRAAPLRDSAFCFWHDPATAEEAADARRLGGQRRRRQKVIAGGYDIAPLGTVEGVRRLLELAAIDAAALENSIARSRTLAGIASVALRLIEVEVGLAPPEPDTPRIPAR